MSDASKIKNLRKGLQVAKRKIQELKKEIKELKAKIWGKFG